MLHILRSYNANSNYMARYACRPIPPRPEGRGFSGFPVMFDGKAPKAHVRVGTVKVDTDQVVARQEPEAKRG